MTTKSKCQCGHKQEEHTVIRGCLVTDCSCWSFNPCSVEPTVNENLTVALPSQELLLTDEEIKQELRTILLPFVIQKDARNRIVERILAKVMAWRGK